MNIFNSYYRLKLSPLVGGNFSIISLAKSGNHEVFNWVFEHLDCVQIKKMVVPNGLADLIQYFIVDKNSRTEQPLCVFQFTDVDSLCGYGKFQSNVNDALVIRKIDDEIFEVFISNGNKSLCLQLFRLFLDGKLKDEETPLLYKLRGLENEIDSYHQVNINIKTLKGSFKKA